MVSDGFCQCGCGQRTRVAPYSDRNRGWVKGQPIRFCHGHNSKGSSHPQWKGGKTNCVGYIGTLSRNHPRSYPNGYVLEHILIAERILGKPLPRGAQLHHINGDRSDNRPENLVICQDYAYHSLLHQRERALKACGHANWRKCQICKTYDDSKNLTNGKSRIGINYHRKCGTRRKEVSCNASDGL